ncbi:hypothetical protein [Cohnella sp. JJ-181]|uniref:hypothetical protein n=1 Tax=Cohnella rhizoplanae TaxID=2974897 RepID=UPI0022FF5125|nr:hypothetical protein COHCIP112018_01514 [Cohnella sp. JJ-181]
MEESHAHIISQYAKLADHEQQQLVSALSLHFGEQLEISEDGLNKFGATQLEIIKNALGGLILTKENVPDIREAYERLKGTDLPRSVSFGRLKDKNSFTIVQEGHDQTKSYVKSRMIEFNAMHFPNELHGRFQELNLSLINDQGVIQGGLTGEFCWN